jgi:hypothetical protein
MDIRLILFPPRLRSIFVPNSQFCLYAFESATGHYLFQYESIETIENMDMYVSKVMKIKVPLVIYKKVK